MPLAQLNGSVAVGEYEGSPEAAAQHLSAALRAEGDSQVSVDGTSVSFQGMLAKSGRLGVHRFVAFDNGTLVISVIPHGGVSVRYTLRFARHLGVTLFMAAALATFSGVLNDSRRWALAAGTIAWVVLGFLNVLIGAGAFPGLIRRTLVPDPDRGWTGQ